MRILTVRQPWAWAIIHGGKDVENRVRNIAGDYRGPVAIHVAMADAEDAPVQLSLDHAVFYRQKYGKHAGNFSWRDCERGYIIGVVDLIDVHTADKCYGDSMSRAAHLYRTDSRSLRGSTDPGYRRAHRTRDVLLGVGNG